MVGKRILVIGCPGSGKSCFARELAAMTGLALFHLDMLYWNADKTMVSNEVFHARLQKILEKDAWIIDGNYASTLEMRLNTCDTVFLLDYPAEICIEGVLARMHKPRPDLPWTETETDPEFMDFIRSFRQNVLPGMLEALKQHDDKHIIIFRTREEAQRHLDKIKEGFI